MFDDLKSAWISEIYKDYSAILLPSVNKQLSTDGLVLDLNSLPTFPIPFKELFIRWLIMINRERISKNQEVIITKEIVLQCPIWKVIRPPLSKLKLTKESVVTRPTGSIGSKGTVGTMGAVPTGGKINKSYKTKGINR